MASRVVGDPPLMEYWYDAMAAVPSLHVIRIVLSTTADEQVGGVTINEAKTIGTQSELDFMNPLYMCIAHTSKGSQPHIICTGKERKALTQVASN